MTRPDGMCNDNAIGVWTERVPVHRNREPSLSVGCHPVSLTGGKPGWYVIEKSHKGVYILRLTVVRVPRKFLDPGVSSY